MLHFTDLAQRYPNARSARERQLDFREIATPFVAEDAARQASRCSQCGVPFCQVHCPLGNNIPDWLKLAAEGRLREAYAMASATNTFPEICGRICPQDKLCEGNCVIEPGFGAVTIGAVEKHITETAFAEGWVRPIQAARASGQSVGIIGAGPAGLAAADQLRRQGHAVTVYDRYDRVGGLMVYGIPNFKLDKQVVQRREALLRAGGIVFELNCAIGRDVTWQALRQRHDALLVATGVYQGRTLAIPGSELGSIVPAMDYLTASNRKGLGDHVPAFDDGMLNAAGKRVVVIGGGDTAMDCVRTAVRQGAAHTLCLYRRDRANMPGSQREVGYAQDEGVAFQWLAAPLQFLGEQGVVRAVQFQRMAMKGAPGSARQSIEPIAGDTGEVAADLVINALGFEPEDMPAMFGAPELQVTKHGTLRVDAAAQTSVPGVFAAGDIVRGASLVVWAIRDGREAAGGIHAYLRARQAGAA